MGLGRRGFACLIAFLLISAGLNGAPARAQSGPDDPGFEFQWALSQIGVQDAWAIGRGRNASVAVLDTGVDLVHEDLTGRLLSGGRDTHGDEPSPQDDRGEGTHVAGIIAASTNNGTGVAGIAYEAKILPIKVLDSDGDGFEVNVIEGIRLAIEKKVDVMVVNLDEGIVLADGGFNFEDAIRDAWAAGIVPVIGADHSFVRSNAFSDAPALVVAGVTRSGNTSPQSNGVGSAKWGIAAPGGSGTGTEDDIFSTYLPGTRQDGLGETREYGRYLYDSGDIQAAAHVAGAAAILRGLGQTPQQTVDRLLSSANDAGVTGRDRVYGVGVLHAGKSVRGLAADRAGAAGGQGTPTSAAGGQSNGGGGNTPAAPPGTVAPPGTNNPGDSQSPPSASGALGTAAGAEVPAEGAQDGSATASGAPGDVVGGLSAAADPEEMPGRTPLLPLVAFLLLVGSGTITWALRRRTLHPTPPLNS
ncbi:MAG TPA: S8 family serine peptidase [Acidimicrobiales bacterium]|nr:S8 family serine peptidase [Acidimicrobiales bacterium]